MKRLQLKTRLLVWHSAAFTLLLLGTLPIMHLSVSENVRAEAESLLISTAEQISRSLVSDAGGGVRLDSSLDLSGSGISAAVFSNDNFKMAGTVPLGFPDGVAPGYGRLRDSKTNSHEWLYYDLSLTKDRVVIGWLRSYITLDPTNAVLDAFKEKLYLLIPAYVVISVLTMAGGSLVTQVFTPVLKMTAAAKQIGRGDLSKRLSYGSLDNEVGVLAQTINEMLDRLENMIEREKRFSSDVSHELRSPLTAVMVSAEGALSDGTTEPEFRQALNSILDESHKMNALISQLLLMAKSSNGLYEHPLQPQDISALTEAVVESFRQDERGTDSAVSMDIERGIVFPADQTLYMQLLFNLLDNAVKYNVPGGRVHVSLRLESELVILSVQDSGIGISEEDIPRIWNRFYKVQKSGPDSSPGLGLAIVRWIAELHGGTVSVRSTLGQGSIFEIRFATEKNA